MNSLDLAFLSKKYEELKANGGLLILKPKHSARIPDLSEVTQHFPDIKPFYIGEGEEERIVLQYIADIPKFNSYQYRTVADKAFARREYDKTIELYTAILSLKKPMPHVYARLGLSYLYTGDFYKAIDFLIVATELSKRRKKGKYDFTNLISKLLRKKDEELEEDKKPAVSMQGIDFRNDLEDDYGIEKIKDIAILINFQGMTIEEACRALNVNDEDKNIVMLFIAKESYAKEDYDLGDRILKRVEKMPNKTSRVKQLLEEIRSKKLFYKNRVTKDFKPLIRVRVKTH